MTHQIQNVSLFDAIEQYLDDERQHRQQSAPVIEQPAPVGVCTPARAGLTGYQPTAGDAAFTAAMALLAMAFFGVAGVVAGWFVVAIF
jgi:hypothetical protein